MSLDEIAYSERQSRALLRCRLLIELAKDVRVFDWRLPRARGIAFALRHLDEIPSAPHDRIDDVLERFQSIWAVSVIGAGSRRTSCTAPCTHP